MNNRGENYNNALNVISLEVMYLQISIDKHI